jgi:hypothetical protein
MRIGLDVSSDGVEPAEEVHGVDSD